MGLVGFPGLPGPEGPSGSMGLRVKYYTDLLLKISLFLSVCMSYILVDLNWLCFRFYRVTICFHTSVTLDYYISLVVTDDSSIHTGSMSVSQNLASSP